MTDTFIAYIEYKAWFAREFKDEWWHVAFETFANHYSPEARTPGYWPN